MTDLEKAFRILNVSPGADAATIRKAWRALVRTYHPDTARDDPEGANKRLTEINVAFDAVSTCKPEDIEKLKAEIAKRDRMAERMRQEQMARRKEAREKHQREQQDAQKKSRASASAREAHVQTKEAKSAHSKDVPVSSVVVAKPARKKPNTEKGDIRSLVARAEEGFVEAMQVCSRFALQPRRSSYL